MKPYSPTPRSVQDIVGACNDRNTVDRPTLEDLMPYQPGMTSSVTAAPPRRCLLSSTTTFFPAFCKYAAYSSKRVCGELQHLHVRSTYTYSRTHGDQAIVSSTDYRYVEPPGKGAPASYGQRTSARTS